MTTATEAAERECMAVMLDGAPCGISPAYITPAGERCTVHAPAFTTYDEED